MSEPVKLYVYDLSNGLARQMSLQLTGRQIDGIWHTSIVVYGKEIFYGQGINITAPGRSHHGQPLQIVDLGSTDIDEGTLNEYIDEMKEHYTADKYHLLEFNCNSFTNDFAAFLTGGSIPDYIKDLPSDFLATPFGAALRPTIDGMYRRPGPGLIPTTQLPTPAATPTPPNPNPQLAASILQAVAAQAQSQNQTPSSGNPATESLASPLHTVTNSASFAHLLKTHKAVVVNFSNIQTCPPCRVIAPIYEQLARDKGGPRGAAFTKIDLSTSSGQSLGQEWKVRVMPTFMFFLDGNKISEMKGANENELRSEIDLLLFQAYPPHPHTSLSLPAIQSLSLTPILFTQVPALDTVLTKLTAFIDSATWPGGIQSQAEVKQVLSTSFIPFLKSRFNGAPTPTTLTPNIQILSTWTKTTSTLFQILPIESLFPLVDVWRLGVLDVGVSSFVSTAATTSASNPILGFLAKSSSTSELPKPYLLTLLRLLSNTFSNPLLGMQFLTTSTASSTGSARAHLTAILVPTLLHSDVGVRTAAASLVFNVAAVVQKGRVASLNGTGGGADSTPNGGSRGIEDEDWEMEIISAIVEAIDREGGNEDVVHRLTASLAFLIRLSPSYQTQLAPLLEVLQTKAILKSKVQVVVKKKDVKRLVEEVADKLCP